MTRKEALEKAILLLSYQKNTEEILQKLRELSDDLPLVHWTDRSIRDTVDQFLAEHGRIPTVTDFKKRNMPSHSVIRQKYGVSLSEWLKQNYPTAKLNSTEQRKKDTQEFITEYLRIKPDNQKEFNRNRKSGIKGWRTVAAYHGVKSWKKLILVLQLPVFPSPREKQITEGFTVKIYTDLNTEELTVGG